MLQKWSDFCHCQVPIVRARVEDIVRRADGPSVLEVGCNEGFVSKALIEKGLLVSCVDNRDEAIRQTKENYGIEALKADANKLPFSDNSFDTVIGGELLEHLTNPGIGLSEMFRVSKKQVIISIPIGSYWNDEITHLWQLNSSIVDHEGGIQKPLKVTYVIEFRKIRVLNQDGSYTDIFKYWPER